MTTMERICENELRALSGARARPWGFSPTHGRLVVQITFSSGDEAYLQCVMCEKISVRTIWRWQNPQLVRAGKMVQVEDGEISIHCEELWLQPTAELGRDL